MYVCMYLCMHMYKCCTCIYAYLNYLCCSLFSLIADALVFTKSGSVLSAFGKYILASLQHAVLFNSIT